MPGLSKFTSGACTIIQGATHHWRVVFASANLQIAATLDHRAPGPPHHPPHCQTIGHTDDPIAQHSDAFGLGVSALTTREEDIYDKLKNMLSCAVPSTTSTIAPYLTRMASARIVNTARQLLIPIAMVSAIVMKPSDVVKA